MDTSQHRVAITGGASGLGEAIAREVARRGSRVALLDLPSPRLDRIAEELDAVPVHCDVRDAAAVDHAFVRVAAELGGLDGMVVAAGIQLHDEDGPAASVPLEVWERTLAVNLTGAFLCVKHALPALIASGDSSIVLIGSPTGLTMSGAGYAAYAASKAGMMSLARTVAADYARDGVRANVIVPGTIETPLIRTLLDDPATHEALVQGTPLGRLGRPEDIAGLAAWLLSREARFATGAFFAVDGGLTAR